MLIGSRLEYALKILIELADRKGQGLVTSKLIAQECGIPPNFIPQIVAALSKRGWIKSTRGPHGGIMLETDPDKISVNDVIEALEDKLVVKECLFTKKPCEQSKTCPLYPLWNKIQDRMMEVVEGTSVADLAREKSLLAAKK